MLFWLYQDWDAVCKDKMCMSGCCTKFQLLDEEERKNFVRQEPK